ncbi:MAG TPA: hypothetical protein VFD58_01905 [Blastocatellia bacterium]|nr:hypothetical protein [Blastocatellia bacterium]
MGEIINEIHRIEHFHTLACSKCQKLVRYQVLQIYATCPACDTRHQVRSFGGIGTEVEDVIDAVLEWAGDGESFKAVMKRRDEIRSEKDA